jgi:hypothetical protein
LADTISDHSRVVVDGEDHGALEGMWPRDEQTESTLEPGLARNRR